MEVSVRELKSHLSSYLARAQAGEDLVVTAHKRPVATLRGLPAAAEPGIEALLKSGLAFWQGGKPAGSRRRPVIDGKTLAAMVLEDRG